VYGPVPLPRKWNKLTVLVGAAGFEPANGGIKSRCLTTWRRPNRKARL